MKRGDKVRITKKPTKTYIYPFPEPFVSTDYRGTEGIIVGNEKDEFCYKQQRYWVRIKGVVGDKWFCYDELEVIR